MKTLKLKPVRGQLDDLRAKKKREGLDYTICTLKSELSEACKDLNFLKKNHLRSRDMVWSKQDRVSKLEQEIRKMTPKLQDPRSTKKNKWRVKLGIWPIVAGLQAKRVSHGP